MSKGNFLFGTVRGKLGDMVLYRTKSEQRSRTYLGSGMISNPKTDSQMTVRVQLSNLVSFYRQGKNLLYTSFTYKKSNQSDYNAFVGRNLNKTPIYLTKTQASFNACIVAPYIISYGPLTPIEVSTYDTESFITNISVGDLTVDDETTVGDFASAILENNQSFVEGARITFASFIQYTNAETGYPYIQVNCYQFDLDTSSTDILRDSFPEFCSTVIDGYIGTGSSLADGGFAYIYSYRDSEGVLKCSTQRVIMNSELYLSYNDETALQSALASYDATGDSILSSASDVTEAVVALATSINRISVNGTIYTSSSSTVSIAEGDTLTIYGNSLSSIETVTLYTGDDSSSTAATDVTSFDAQAATYITLTVPSISGSYLASIYLDGVEYNSYTLPTSDDSEALS